MMNTKTSKPRMKACRPRGPITITSINKPDPSLAAEAAVALILDYHAKTSRPVPSQREKLLANEGGTEN